MIGKPDTQRFVGLDLASGGDEFHGERTTDQPREPLRAAKTRRNSETDFRLTEYRTLASDNPVACHRKFAPTSERVAVDQPYHWHRQRLDRLHHTRALFGKCVRLQWTHGLHRADIGARNECFVARARNEQHPCIGIICDAYN